MNLVVAETAMGKPLFKASDGDQIDILREKEGLTQSELQQGSETQVVYVTKVRPEAFPNGSPMSVRENFYNVKVKGKEGVEEEPMVAPHEP